ncbi:MAG: glycosyltransferase, partial [Nitrosarchaeum sp.]
MDKKQLVLRVLDCIKKESGDFGRNHYILKRLNENKIIFDSDKKYLERLMKIKIDSIENNYDQIRLNKIKQKYKTVFLNPKLVKCNKCKIEINLNEKSTRQKNEWYHSNCFEIKSKTQNDYDKISHGKIQKYKLDWIQALITATIFTFLVISVYFILGPLSMVAMGLGGSLLVYHLVSASSKIYSKNKPGKHGPSAFLLFLIISPFIIGGVIAYEGYSLAESPVRIILLWAMTISFWSTMLFVPMAVISKYKEEQQDEPKSYPTISIIIPAYNEEKVIARTIEALLETKYPKKEIIFVDDGSKDRTLDIAMQYNDKIKVLNKENGGKASALNYALVYAKGEIVVIVDADTIIGRN